MVTFPSAGDPTPWGPTLQAYIDDVRTSIFTPVGNMLDDGESVSIGWLTDSTGDDPTTEHIGLTCDALHTQWPNHRVEFSGYDNGSANNFTGAKRVVKYAGTTTERKVTFAGTVNSGLTLPATSVTSITGDLDVRFKVAMSDWTVTGERVMGAKAGVAGARSWYMCKDGANFVLYYSADGTALSSATCATSNFTLTNGVATWVRATLDVDNGASGRSVKFYQSTDDGATWVQKGSTTTTAGVIALFTDSVTALELGGRNFSGTSNWVGDIYRAEIRSGIDGAIVAPTLPDLWNPNTSAFDGVFSGDPVIQVWAAAAAGWGMSNFVTNVNNLVPAAGQVLHMMGTSHNDSNLIGANYWAQWDTVMSAVRTRIPCAAIGVHNQNPEKTPETAIHILMHKRRCIQLQSYAASRGYEFTDVYSAFLAADPTLATLVSDVDGEHPTAAGSVVWSAAIRARWLIS